MNEGFSESLRERARPIWESISRCPFLAEIKAGTLPLEKFRYYLIQDYKYLDAFARCVALVLAKAPTAEALDAVAKRLVTPIERPLHKKLMPMLGLTEDELRSAPASPTNLAYGNHMIRAASLGSWAEGIAALLPCPWTYHLLGDWVGRVDHPVFGPWSAVYADGLLAESVRLWTTLLDQATAGAPPEEREAVAEAFMVSSRYEWMFWEMAYGQERWPV